MVKISRLWNIVDNDNNIILFNRPRISIQVDEYVWNIIEENIVLPNRIMKTSRFNYSLVVTLAPYNSKAQYRKCSPYNGKLKEGVVTGSNGMCHQNDFVNGEKQTTWFKPEKFWINMGNKTALVGAEATYVDEQMTPMAYADLLYDAFAALILFNFKKLKMADFERVKTLLKEDIICGFPFPAPFEEQKYTGDNGGFRCDVMPSDEGTNILIDIPNVKEAYKKYFGEK